MLVEKLDVRSDTAFEIKYVTRFIFCVSFVAKDDFNAFLVANDKYNLYPTIADKAGMQIVNQFRRPVLNRTERDKSPYSEIIFHLKSKV